MTAFTSAYPGTIKSIQRGTVTIANGATSGTATISSVTTGKSQLTLLGVVCSYATGVSSTTNSFGALMCDIDLTNSTTITCSRSVANVEVGTITARYQVLEFY